MGQKLSNLTRGVRYGRKLSPHTYHINTITEVKKLLVDHRHGTLDIPVTPTTKGHEVRTTGFLQSGHRSAKSAVDGRPNRRATQTERA